MRQTLIITTLLAVAVFATGYVVGQVTGITAGSAASSGSSQPRIGIDTYRGFGRFDANRTLGAFDRSAGPHADGQVTAVNGNTVTIKPDAAHTGEQESVTTIVLTSSTQYSAGPSTSATKDSIKVGSFVIVQGTLSADGKTLTASRVMIASGVPSGGARFGGYFQFQPSASQPNT